MKAKKLHLLLVIAGLLATERSLDAHILRLGESDPKTYLYAPNALALDLIAQEENSFFDTDWDAVEAPEKAAISAYTKTLENKVAVEDKKITTLKKQLKATNDEVQKIIKEHAQLIKNNVEKMEQ